MANSVADQKYKLITRGLQEVLGGDLIKAILAEGRSPKCYWGVCAVVPVYKVSHKFCLVGTAPTGRRENCCVEHTLSRA